MLYWMDKSGIYYTFMPSALGDIQVELPAIGNQESSMTNGQHVIRDGLSFSN